MSAAELGGAHADVFRTCGEPMASAIPPRACGAAVGWLRSRWWDPRDKELGGEWRRGRRKDVDEGPETTSVNAPRTRRLCHRTHPDCTHLVSRLLLSLNTTTITT